MRKLPTVKNAFKVTEVVKITGLSADMLHYLTSRGYLLPSYREDHRAIRGGRRRPRGSAKFYSYRDLLIARIIYNISEAGVQLTKIKRALNNLTEDEHWINAVRKGTQDKVIHWLVTDGVDVFLHDNDGYINLMKKGGQRSFSFVLEMRKVQAHVRREIGVNCREKLRHYRLSNEEPIVERTGPANRKAKR